MTDKIFKVTATSQQLYSIGLDDDLLDKEGRLISEFPDKWLNIEFTYHDRVFGERTNKFDLPPSYVEEVVK